jgi:hypothetical protein
MGQRYFRDVTSAARVDHLRIELGTVQLLFDPMEGIVSDGPVRAQLQQPAAFGPGSIQRRLGELETGCRPRVLRLAPRVSRLGLRESNLVLLPQQLRRLVPSGTVRQRRRAASPPAPAAG